VAARTETGVLIIAIGWDGVTRPAAEIAALQQCQVKILKSGEALKLFKPVEESREIGCDSLPLDLLGCGCEVTLWAFAPCCI